MMGLIMGEISEEVESLANDVVSAINPPEQLQ